MSLVEGVRQGLKKLDRKELQKFKRSKKKRWWTSDED